MSSFDRVVDGYFYMGYYSLSGLLKSGSSLIASVVDGPYNILGIQISQLSGYYSDFMDAMIKIELDGVVAYDGYIYWLLMAYPGYVAHTMFSTIDIPSAYWVIISFRVAMSCAATYKCTLYTANTTGNTVYVNIDICEGAL